MRIHSFILAFLTSALTVAFAQSGPDIIWATNAHYDLHAVALSGNSLFVVSCGQDQKVKVWNATNATLVRTFMISGGAPESVAMSQDGTYAAAGDGGGRTRAWRMQDGGIQWQSSTSDDFIYGTIFAPDNIHFAEVTYGHDILVRYSLATGQGSGFSGHANEVLSVTFSPDSSFIASGSRDQTARLWRVNDRTLLRTFTGHAGEVPSVDFSPDGKLLATASTDGTARIWNVTNGECLRVLQGGGGPHADVRGGCSAKFSADGSLLFTLNDYMFTWDDEIFTSDDYVFKIWRVSNGACVGTITNTGAIVFDIAKNGKYFAYGTYGDVSQVVLARMPLVIDEVSLTGNQTILSWQGGSGLYQLQSRTNLLLGSWSNVGSATTNTVVTNLSSSTLFFRVQSLPAP